MNGRVKKVLVVDDDELLREFYTRVLAKLGCEALGAANGDEAMRLLEDGREEFSLVILDLLMPIRTGWELLDFLERRPARRTPPVLVITGLAASFEEFEDIRNRCDEVLLKGEFELATFCRVVESLIGRSEEEHARSPAQVA